MSDYSIIKLNAYIQLNTKLINFFVERAFFVGRALKVVPAGGYFRQNEQVTLLCISTDEHHQPVPVIWFKNNLIIASNGSNVIIDDYRSLTIIKFQQEDEGFYHCETHQEKFFYSPVVPVIYSS